MKKIVKSYVIVTAVILCMTFLIGGIYEVNSETSYVMSGEKADVVRAQSTTSQRLLVKSGKQSDEEILSFDFHNITLARTLLCTALPAPLSQLVWILEDNVN